MKKTLHQIETGVFIFQRGGGGGVSMISKKKKNGHQKADFFSRSFRYFSLKNSLIFFDPAKKPWQEKNEF